MAVSERDEMRRRLLALRKRQAEDGARDAERSAKADALLKEAGLLGLERFLRRTGTLDKAAEVLREIKGVEKVSGEEVRELAAEMARTGAEAAEGK